MKWEKNLLLQGKYDSYHGFNLGQEEAIAEPMQLQ